LVPPKIGIEMLGVSVALNELPDEQREVFVAHELEGRLIAFPRCEIIRSE